ncbi:MAG: primosomal protein N' [Lachnospiraceae bacterium]|nr:primosomal protein N' [Lachnospiraceae bacterium]
MKYANIIVNISHENLDRTFQYIIPGELENNLGIGDYVSISFGPGNRIIKGYVLEITDTAVYDPEKLKEIISVDTDSRFVEYKLIRLAYWMKQTYGSTMINALKTVLPIKKIMKEKEEKSSIILNIPVEEAREKLEQYERNLRTIARARLLKELINEKQLDYRLVTAKLNISPATIRAMEKQEIIAVEKKRVYRNTAGGEQQSNRITLNEEQSEAASSIIRDYSAGIRKTYLIHGITGSGKTEVYMEVIDAVIKEGKQVIMLIPEIALTYQTVMRFYRRFGDRVSTLHSRLSDGEKYDQFERARKGEISIMIGPRSALFTPFDSLGLIVIDEEHESSYKSDNMPKYHAVKTAGKLAELHGASLILGSATPSLDSYYMAMRGEYGLFRLNKRIGDAKLPAVHLVDLREELREGNRSMFSRELKSLMEERLDRNEQIMLFLNRRGYAGFISCRSCGHVMKCPHCDVSLSEHLGGKLICHYCGYETVMTGNCPECGSEMIGSMRAGTEKVEEAVKKMFPYASVLRMDADTTRQKDSYERILSAFANREADILIGTQMIVKGHDFPFVTLMGIIIADMSLNAGDYRAAERTFQLLTQAAGRAGRADAPGDVVIQTYNPEHYAVEAAAGQDYERFYNDEMAYRSLMGYPPAGHMLAILIESADEEAVDRYSKTLAEELNDVIIKGLHAQGSTLIGPVDASVKKINDIYRKVMYIKSVEGNELIFLKDQAEGYCETYKDRNIRVTFDMDPVRGY